MSNIRIKLISVITVMVMVLCAFVPVVSSGVSDADQSTASYDDIVGDEKKTYKYVSLGDSMTSGYGLSGYFTEDDPNGFLTEVNATYSHLITEYLKGELGSGYDVKHIQLAIGSARSTEARAFIDDTFFGKDGYLGDDLTKELLYNKQVSFDKVFAKAEKEYPEFGLTGIDLMKAIYQKELSEADMISFHSELDYPYAFLVSLLGEAFFGVPVENDFSLYFSDEFIEKAQIVEYVKKVVIEFLKELGLDLEKIVDTVDKIIEAAVYSVVGYCSNFDKIMEFVFENNPDAKVMVIDSYSMYDDICIEVGGVSVNVSDLYSSLVSIANDYVQYCSPYALKCYHVDITEHPCTFADEFKNVDLNGPSLSDQVSNDAKADMMFVLDAEKFAPADAKSVAAYNLIDRNGNLTKFMKYIFSSSHLDIVGMGSVDETVLGEKFANALDMIGSILYGDVCEVTYNEADGTCTVSAHTESYVFSKDELSTLFVGFILENSFIMIHAGPLGNGYIAQITEDVIAEKDVLTKRVFIQEKEYVYDKIEYENFLYELKMAYLHGVVNSIYMNWDDMVDFILSDSYAPAYQEFKEIYDAWHAYYSAGNITEALNSIHMMLQDLYDNWDIIFGVLAHMIVFKLLRNIVAFILSKWDNIADGIETFAKAFDHEYTRIIEFLAPKNIHEMINDTTFTQTYREFLLNLSLNWGTFSKQILDDIESSRSIHGTLIRICKTVKSYVAPCHECLFCDEIEHTAHLPGYKAHYECKICSSCYVDDGYGGYSSVSIEEITVPAGHDLIEHPAVAPSCTEEGNNLYYTCEGCSIVYKADMITETTVEAETLPMTEHKHVLVPGKTPTKTEAGYSDGEKCETCGKIFTEQKVLPATGSDITVIETEKKVIEYEVTDSDETKAIIINFTDKEETYTSTISIPENSMGAVKGKTIIFGVEKSTEYENAFVISLTADGSAYNSEVYITLPYDTSKGVDSIKWIEGDVTMSDMTIDEESGTVTFKTTHNSTYQIIYSSASELPLEVLIVLCVLAICLVAGIAVIVWKNK